MNDRLVWIDCEMTSLDLGADALIEVAALVTDFDLNVLGTGVDLIIKPPAAPDWTRTGKAPAETVDWPGLSADPWYAATEAKIVAAIGQAMQNRFPARIVAGKGPFGFQSDVFDNPPGTEGYSPLRSIHAVTWADPAKARELKSAAEVKAATDAGEVSIEQPGVVVNMPFVVWDGGKR